MPRATSVISFRAHDTLHARICEMAGGEAPGAFLRRLAAAHVGYDLATAAPSKPRKAHRPPSQRQLDLREAVRHLGEIGARLVACPDVSPDVVAEIRSAVAATVAAVTAPR